MTTFFSKSRNCIKKLYLKQCLLILTFPILSQPIVSWVFFKVCVCIFYSILRIFNLFCTTNLSSIAFVFQKFTIFVWPTCVYSKLMIFSSKGVSKAQCFIQINYCVQAKRFWLTSCLCSSQNKIYLFYETSGFIIFFRKPTDFVFIFSSGFHLSDRHKRCRHLLSVYQT